MPRGKQPLKQARGGLRFIDAGPASKQSKSESIRLIRSHVGRWTWQQLRRSQRQESADEEEDKEEDADSGNAGESGALDHTEEVVDTHATATTTTTTNNQFNKDVGQLPSKSSSVAIMPPLATTTTTTTTTTTANTSTANPSNLDSASADPTTDPLFSMQINCIHADILDPFQAYVGSPLSADLVSLSNKYCLGVLWPGLMPRSWLGTVHAGVHTWFSSSVYHPALHSAMLFGCYSHRRTQSLSKGQGHFSAADMKQLTLCEADSIAKITAAIQDPSQAVSDPIILSVLCLANNRYDDFGLRHRSESPFQAPLRSLQWLDIYGRLNPNPVHQTGLYQLVYLRGGLENIGLPGLAAILSFSSILYASRTLSQPLFPFISLETGVPKALQELLFTQGAAETAAQESDPLVEINASQELHVVFRGMRAYVSLVEAFLDGAQVGVDGRILSDHRNLVQWHVMSLAPASQLREALSAICWLYEPCRLALVIFGVGVTFPLPPDVANLSNLAKDLQVELQSLEQSILLENRALMRVYCWCLVLGGIAATGTPTREWFVQELGSVAKVLDLATWNQLRALLRSILWFDNACDIAGTHLWSEVLNLTSRPADLPPADK